MSNKKNQDMLEQMSDLRQVYKYSFIESIEKCEELVLEMEKTKDVELSHKLKGIIHTLKGTCGSYMLDELSQTFHKYEDQIFTLNKNNFDNFIQNSLIYFEKLVAYANSNFDDAKKINFSDIFFSGKDLSKEQIDILITESSHTIIKIIKDSLAPLNVNFSVAEDGITAIERIIKEKFDILITGIQLEHLDGESLVKALKVMKTQNQKTACILITSENYQKEDRLSPNLVVSKNKEIGSKIYDFCIQMYPKSTLQAS